MWAMAKEYDIKGNPFNFGLDLAYGEKGEGEIRSFLEAVVSGDIEVKTDRYRNGRMVLEMEHNPRKQQNPDGTALWKPSGLAITKAKWWVYVYTLDGSFVIVSVPRIKRYLKANKERFNKKKYHDFARASSNPSKGYLLQPEDVMDMMINTEYDEVRTNLPT